MNARPVLALAALIALLASAPAAAEPARVALPAPSLEGKVPVEAALHQRRSVRSWAGAPLALAEVGQLCWAAQGVTDGKGHRTAPSAQGTYPLTLYVVAGAVDGLAPGVYRYLPAEHALERTLPGLTPAAFQQKGVPQPWVGRAPAVFAIAGTAARISRAGDRGQQFMAIEAGLAAQGFFLQAEALGLGSTFVGGFQPADARAALGLASGDEVLGVLPVGRRP